MSTDSDRKTYAQVEAQRQKEAREREEQTRAWARDVTEELTRQNSKFMLEFTTDEKRIFGVIE